MSTLIAEPLPPATPKKPYRRFDPARVVGTMTEDEYWDFLQQAKHKYHYVYGEVVQMAGASIEHNLIAMNTGKAIRNALEAVESDCEVLGSDQRVSIAARLQYFPDLVVVCGDWRVTPRDGLQNPVAIIEVLLHSTETDGRTDKFLEYQQIPSLHHYILIDQSRIAVTHFEKMADTRWVIAGDYRALTDTLTIPLNDQPIVVALSQIYRRLFS